MASQSFSEGVDNALHYLRPHGRNRTSFPDMPEAAELRQEPGENSRQWFIRLVKTYCQGDARRCAIEDNIGIFALLYWRRNALIGASLHAFAADGLLEDIVADSDKSCNVFYLRLDLDYDTLGRPFTHPFPHVHVSGAPSPRFSPDGGGSGNVVMDFFDFLYRHYAHEKWSAWVRREWNSHFDFASTPEEENPLDRIFQAFTDNELRFLRRSQEPLAKLKSLLRRRKDELFGYVMEISDRALLSYP